MMRLVILAAVLAGLWAAGLMVFVYDVKTMPQNMPILGVAATDAAVVLTGGSERLAAGVELLQRDVVKKLFVSGVHPKTPRSDLLAGLTLDPEKRRCCINLGKEAADTTGNASETAAWMEAQQYTSLRVVTANYHVRRALVEFHAALPNITIYPYAVRPDNVQLDGWWKRRGTASLLITEYNKYLAARAQKILNRIAS